MANELHAFVLKETGIKPVAENTVLIGSSYGGLASAYIAYEYPEVFGAVLSLSGSFWWHPETAARGNENHMSLLFSQADKKPLRFFISAGLFEKGRDNSGGILHHSKQLKDVLQAKGYPVIYKEYATGHDYFAWQGILTDGLTALFSGSRHEG